MTKQSQTQQVSQGHTLSSVNPSTSKRTQRESSPLFGLESSATLSGVAAQPLTTASSLAPQSRSYQVYEPTLLSNSWRQAEYESGASSGGLLGVYNSSNTSLAPPFAIKSEPTAVDLTSSYPFATSAYDDYSVSPLPMLGSDASPAMLQHRALSFDATLESPLEANYDSAEGSSEYHPSPLDEFLQAPSGDYSSLFSAAPSTSSTTSITASTDNHNNPVSDEFGGAEGGALNELFPDLRLTTAPQSSGPQQQQQPQQKQEFTFAAPAENKVFDNAQTRYAAAQQQSKLAQLDLEDDEDEAGADSPAIVVNDPEDEEYVPGMEDSAKPSSPRRSRKRKSTVANLRADDDYSSSSSVKRVSRAGSTPAIVPIDAPIQQRIYRGESRTSRKVLPKAMAKTMASHKNRAQSVAQGTAEADEIDDETRAMVDQRRQQNTIAARKSRERKAQHLAGLEESVERLTRENEALRQRLLDAGLEADV